MKSVRRVLFPLQSLHLFQMMLRWRALEEFLGYMKKLIQISAKCSVNLSYKKNIFLIVGQSDCRR